MSQTKRIPVSKDEKTQAQVRAIIMLREIDDLITSEHRSSFRVIKFGNYYDAMSASGWHAVVRDERGEWESIAGPYYTYIMAEINGNKKIKERN